MKQTIVIDGDQTTFSVQWRESGPTDDPYCLFLTIFRGYAAQFSAHVRDRERHQIAMALRAMADEVDKEIDKEPESTEALRRIETLLSDIKDVLLEMGNAEGREVAGGEPMPGGEGE